MKTKNIMKNPDPKTLIRVLRAESKELRYKKARITTQLKENANSIKELTAGKTNQIDIINPRIAHDLKNEVSKWVSNEFNAIQVDTLNAECDDALFEYIDSTATAKGFLKDTSEDTEQLLITFLTEKGYSDTDEEAKALISKLLKKDQTDQLEIIEDSLFNNIESYEENQYSEHLENLREYESYREQQEQDNYPMWNTCFEFDSEPPEDWIQHAKDSGIGIIRHPAHNAILFFAGCGYSFYSAHWIPFYLRCFEEDAKKYAGINYSMV